MTDNNTRKFWLQLADIKGRALADATFIQLATARQSAAHLQNAVKLAIPAILANVASTDLHVHRHRPDFKQAESEIIEQRLEPLTVIAPNKPVRDDLYWVLVVPSVTQPVAFVLPPGTAIYH